MSNAITLFSISELLEKNFFVPSYQRGYRWTKQQVEDLLNDIISFGRKRNKDEKEFYCLQPIVVKPIFWDRKNGKGEIQKVEGWELVDGQQRLTTIRILLAFLIKDHLNGASLKKEYGKDLFSIDYETRELTEDFLNNIEEDNNENIDFYHISMAHKVIREWFEKQGSQRDARESMLRTLVYDLKGQKTEGVVQVIWYQLSDESNSIDTFIRINLGKIALTNSELIKALFLQEQNFGTFNELAKLQQLEIAGEWDRIELALHNEDLWWFLNRTINNPSSRIEFIFTLIKKLAIRNDPELLVRKDMSMEEVKSRQADHLTIEEKIGSDDFSTFRFFYQKFEGKITFELLKAEWESISDCFNSFLEWYNNPIWYHYIGFLIYSGENIIDIFDLTKGEKQTKDEITKALIDKIKSHFKKIEWVCKEDVIFLNLSYGSPMVKDLLLLFNLQYIVKQSQIGNLIFKFPFKAFKEENWNVEHIDSSTNNPLTERTSQEIWLQAAVQDLPEIKNNQELSSRISDFLKSDKSKEIFVHLQSAIVSLAGEDLNEENLKNNIGNLTLLDASTNQSYGNALFPTKRRIIIKKDQTGTFIPICTKNVFLKYFDNEGHSRTNWRESDIIKYREEITNTLIDFLPSKPEVEK